MGNICSDIQGTTTSLRSVSTPSVSEQIMKYFLAWTSSSANKSIEFLVDEKKLSMTKCHQLHLVSSVNSLRDKHGFCMLSTFERSKQPDRYDLF